MFRESRLIYELLAFHVDVLLYESHKQVTKQQKTVQPHTLFEDMWIVLAAFQMVQARINCLALL